MDYARFNYAQPEDNVGRAGYLSRIGDYDNWAIEWGYRLLSQYNSPDAKGYLNNWVMEKLKTNVFGLELRRTRWSPQPKWTGGWWCHEGQYVRSKEPATHCSQPDGVDKMPNEDYTLLGRLYGQVSGQFSRYMGHVVKWM